MRLQQGFAASGMGFGGQVAQQQSRAANVRFVPKADIEPSVMRTAQTSRAAVGTLDMPALFATRSAVNRPLLKLYAYKATGILHGRLPRICQECRWRSC